MEKKERKEKNGFGRSNKRGKNKAIIRLNIEQLKVEQKFICR